MTSKKILSSVHELDEVATELEKLGQTALAAEIDKLASALIKTADYNEAKDYLRLAESGLPHVIKALDRAYTEYSEDGLERDARKVHQFSAELESLHKKLKSFVEQAKQETSEEAIFKKKKHPSDEAEEKFFKGKKPGLLHRLKQKLV